MTRGGSHSKHRLVSTCHDGDTLAYRCSASRCCRIFGARADSRLVMPASSSPIKEKKIVVVRSDKGFATLSRVIIVNNKIPCRLRSLRLHA